MKQFPDPIAPDSTSHTFKMRRSQTRSISNSNISLKTDSSASPRSRSKRLAEDSNVTTKKLRTSQTSTVSTTKQATTKTKKTEVKSNKPEVKNSKPVAESKQVVKDATISNQAKCQICKKTFATTRELCKHVYNYHGLSLFCETCPLYFKNESEKKEHVKSCRKILHTEMFDGVCKICKEEFQTQLALQNHMSVKHKNVDDSKIKDSKLYICPYCGPGKSFPTEKLATKHIFWHHNKLKNLSKEEQKEEIETVNSKTPKTVIDPEQILYVGKLVKSDLGDGFIFVPTLASEFEKGSEIELIEDNLTQTSIVHPIKPLPNLEPLVRSPSKLNKPAILSKQTIAVKVVQEDTTLQNIEAVMSGIHSDEIITFDECDITYVDMTVDSNDPTIISNDIFSGLSDPCIQRVNSHLTLLKQAYVTKMLKKDITNPSQYCIYCFSCNDNIEIIKYFSEHIRKCLPASCYICGKTYKIITSRTKMLIDYIQHLQDHTRFHYTRAILCKQCDRIFINTHNYTGHFAKYHSQKSGTITSFKPNETQTSKTSSQFQPQNNFHALNVAFESLHKIFESVKSKFNCVVKMQCATCNIEFQLSVYIFKHLEICLNKSTTMKCSFCSLFNDTNNCVVQTKDKIKFIEHMKCHLNATENIPIKQCDHCQQFYLNSTNLAHHISAAHSKVDTITPTFMQINSDPIIISCNIDPSIEPDRVAGDVPTAPVSLEQPTPAMLNQISPVILNPTTATSKDNENCPSLVKKPTQTNVKKSTPRGVKKSVMTKQTSSRYDSSLKCHICNLKFLHNDLLVCHIITAHSADKLINGHNCVACKFIAVTKWELQKHVLETHAKFLPINFQFPQN